MISDRRHSARNCLRATSSRKPRLFVGNRLPMSVLCSKALQRDGKHLLQHRDPLGFIGRGLIQEMPNLHQIERIDHPRAIGYRRRIIQHPRPHALVENFRDCVLNRLSSQSASKRFRPDRFAVRNRNRAFSYELSSQFNPISQKLVSWTIKGGQPDSHRRPRHLRRRPTPGFKRHVQSFVHHQEQQFGLVRDMPEQGALGQFGDLGYFARRGGIIATPRKYLRCRVTKPLARLQTIEFAKSQLPAGRRSFFQASVTPFVSCS